MKLTGISMVRNEVDVIEAFVRHHAEVLDELVVVDHSSTDGTAELLRELAGEGLPLTVRREESPVHRQNTVLTRLLRQAATRGGADWVLPLDADEFLVAPARGPRKALRRLAKDRVWTIDLRYYVPHPDDPPDEPNVLRRIRHRRVAEATLGTRKVAVPGALARGRRRTLTQGSHELVDARSGRRAPTSSTDALGLAHFPVRSARQLARKVLGGWPAHVARPDCPEDGAFQWRRAFDAAVAGRLTPGRLHAIALRYPVQEGNGRHSSELVLDPVPVEFELRHPVPPGPAPLEVLAETAVRLAEELSDARRGAPR